MRQKRALTKLPVSLVVSVNNMKYFRNPTIVKIVMFFIFLTFAIASLSPDFMFSMLGSNSTEPFIETVYRGCISWGSTIGWNIGNRKEAGVFVMLVFLTVVLIYYFAYKILITRFNHNKNANKAIKKDV